MNGKLDVPAVVIVPGLRDHVAEHWQTHLMAAIPGARTVPPMGRADLDCAARVDALERVLEPIQPPVVLVAHSGGVITVVHWALRYGRPIHGALLATPADLEQALPEGYPTKEALAAGGWLPVPRGRLPFPSIVAASRNDPLCGFARAARLATGWGSRLVDLGNVGHLNPASGYGVWPRADSLIAELVHASAA
jgi:hypothetical protein